MSIPPPDPKAGSVFIWIVSFFLFLSVGAGGGLLLYYMLKPATDTAPWYPIAGVGLVCLPWFFWFLTFFYRIFSRIFGLRSGDRAAANKTAGENPKPSSESLKRANSQDVSTGSDGRHVHFGAAMVVVDEQEAGHGSRDHDQVERDDIKNHGSSNSSSNDISVNSHESELPLTLSMAS